MVMKMEFTRQEARDMKNKAIHKDMLKKGKRNELFVQLNKRYPTGIVNGIKFPEYVQSLEDEIAQGK